MLTERSAANREQIKHLEARGYQGVYAFEPFHGAGILERRDIRRETAASRSFNAIAPERNQRHAANARFLPSVCYQFAYNRRRINGGIDHERAAAVPALENSCIYCREWLTVTADYFGATGTGKTVTCKSWRSLFRNRRAGLYGR